MLYWWKFKKYIFWLIIQSKHKQKRRLHIHFRGYYVYEHKSYVTKKAILQLLKYIIKIWEHKTTKEKLPIIIPILIYHGKNKWNISTKLSDYIEEIPEPIKKYIPDYEYEIYDLSPKSGIEITGNLLLKSIIEILKSIKTENKKTFIESYIKICDLLEKNEITEKEKTIMWFKIIIFYILSIRDDITPNELIEIQKQRGEEIMSIADKIKLEGKLEGKIEGKLEEKIETAKKMIKANLTTTQISHFTGLTIKEIHQLEKQLKSKK